MALFSTAPNRCLTSSQASSAEWNCPECRPPQTTAVSDRRHLHWLSPALSGHWPPRRVRRGGPDIVQAPRPAGGPPPAPHATTGRRVSRNSPRLANMLTRLTGLTCLVMTADSEVNKGATYTRACVVVSAARKLTRLQCLRLRGYGRVLISQLPDHVGGMLQLRCLEFRGCLVGVVSPAVCQLKRLEALTLISPYAQQGGPQIGSSLPADGIRALVRLRELHVSFHYSPVQELASANLEVLELQVHPVTECEPVHTLTAHTFAPSYTHAKHP